MGTFDQSEFSIRFEWGLKGVETLAPNSDVVVIVDVLRFTTTVGAAIEHDAIIYPYRWKDESVDEFAKSFDALVAVNDPNPPEGSYSLSPHSVKRIPKGTRLVLPSPNGSALSFAAQSLSKVVLAGCLRNARAIAEAAKGLGETFAVVASGELWKQTNDLRPSVEGILGAAAILQHLSGEKSPEAMVAEATLESAGEIGSFLSQTSSGKELIGMGYGDDVDFASEVDASDAVPILSDQAFIRWTG